MDRLGLKEPNAGNGAALVVAVDLTPLQPGESNGGLKPALFRLLSEAMKQPAPPLSFLFLTNTSTHAEIRGFARARDFLICVEDQSHGAFRLEQKLPLEFLLPNPPAAFLRWIGVDLLYAPFGASGFPCEGIPSVALIADVLHRDYPLSLSPAQIAERESSMAQTLQCASMIQCLSQSGLERLRAHYRVPEGKLFVTSLPAPACLNGASAAADFLGEQSLTTPYFFYPADLWKHQNHETLLIAYRLYREQAGEAAWDLVLAFREDKRAAEIRALAQALGIKAHLHCLGDVPEGTLQEWWRHAGALVCPSLHEGACGPLLEAMQYGVPIVSGADFALKEIAGDAACFMDPRKPISIAAALRKMSGQPALREALRCRGRQRLGFYDLRVEARKLLDVWNALPGCKAGFPRKTGSVQEEAVLALPTPASDALWRLTIHANPLLPQNRYSFYLDDAAQGSFSLTQNGGPVFHFDCRPGSRTLRVLISRDRTAPGRPALVREGALQAIAAHKDGVCFSLFEAKEGRAM